MSWTAPNSSHIALHTPIGIQTGLSAVTSATTATSHVPQPQRMVDPLRMTTPSIPLTITPTVATAAAAGGGVAAGATVATGAVAIVSGANKVDTTSSGSDHDKRSPAMSAPPATVSYNSTTLLSSASRVPSTATQSSTTTKTTTNVMEAMGIASWSVLEENKRVLLRVFKSHMAAFLEPAVRIRFEETFARHGTQIRQAAENAQTQMDVYKDAMKIFWDDVFIETQQLLLDLVKTYRSEEHILPILKMSPHLPDRIKTALIRVRLQWLEAKGLYYDSDPLMYDGKAVQLRTADATTLCDLFVEMMVKHVLGLLSADLNPRRLYDFSQYHESYMFRAEQIEDVIAQFLPTSIQETLDYYTDVAQLASMPETMTTARCNIAASIVPTTTPVAAIAPQCLPTLVEPYVPLTQHRQMIEAMQEDSRQQIEHNNKTLTRCMALMESMQKEQTSMRMSFEARFSTMEAKLPPVQTKLDQLEKLVQVEVYKTFSDLQAFHGKLSRDFDTYRRSIEKQLDQRHLEQTTDLKEMETTMKAHCQAHEERVFKSLLHTQQSMVVQLEHWFTDYGQTLNEVQDSVNAMREEMQQQVTVAPLVNVTQEAASVSEMSEQLMNQVQSHSEVDARISDAQESKEYVVGPPRTCPTTGDACCVDDSCVISSPPVSSAVTTPTTANATANAAVVNVAASLPSHETQSHRDHRQAQVVQGVVQSLQPEQHRQPEQHQQHQQPEHILPSATGPIKYEDSRMGEKRFISNPMSSFFPALPSTSLTPSTSSVNRQPPSDVFAFIQQPLPTMANSQVLAEDSREGY